ALCGLRGLVALCRLAVCRGHGFPFLVEQHVLGHAEHITHRIDELPCRLLRAGLDLGEIAFADAIAAPLEFGEQPALLLAALLENFEYARLRHGSACLPGQQRKYRT